MSSTRPAARAPEGASQTPRIVGAELCLGDLRLPLYSGALHYFRHDRESWTPALQALRRLGLFIVESYVPWGVHERADGSFDFGAHDPRKDLGAFLDLAGSLGLYVFLRPGPHVNAELTYFGLPERVVFDPECQARSPRGLPVPFIAPPRMFPVPSYASERFLAETSRYYAAVAEVVAPRTWPSGPVVLLQVDNEAAFYFRDAPFDQDHHPDALAKYARFARERFATLPELNAAYGTTFAAWDEVTPPGRFDGSSHAALRRQLDLMAFHEALLVGALARLKGELARHGLAGLPLVHNLPMGEAGLPLSLPALERVVDVAGLDYYHRACDLPVVKQRTLRLAGSSRFAYAPELGLGAPPWLAARSERDSLTTLLAACAYGVRGMNLYMAVDRDRWYGAPIDERGHDRPSAEPLARVLRALTSVSFHALKRRVEVGIVLPKTYARLSRATHTLGALSPLLLAMSAAGATAACLRDDLGFAAPIQLQWARLVRRFESSLTALGVPYLLIESDADLQRHPQLRALLLPSYEVADELWSDRLDAFARRGGRVLYGPLLPMLDERLAPTTFHAPLGATRVDVLDQTDADHVTQALVSQLGLAQPFPATPRGVETCAHEDATGPRVLFVLQPAPQRVLAEVRLPSPLALTDVLTDERFEGARSVSIPLDGHSCRMLLISAATPPAPRRRPPSARRSEAPPC